MSYKTKIQKSFVDEGFGFPVVLMNVPMLQVRGKWTPNINYKRFADAVLEALAHKPTRLTGNEVKFIRHKLEMTLEQFAKRFGQKSHQAVMKWEAAKGRSTAMLWPTEKDIRLAIIHSFHRSARNFVNLYDELKEQKPAKPERVRIEAEDVAA